MALEWLYYLDYKLREMGRVRHVRSGGEVQVLTPAEMVSVDGFDQETKTIYEFYGCPRCLPRNRDVRCNCHKDRTVNEVYDATEREAAMLRQAGYQVIEKWECDFNQDKKTDPQLKSFLQDLEMVPPLRTEGCFLSGSYSGSHSLCQSRPRGRHQILRCHLSLPMVQ